MTMRATPVAMLTELDLRAELARVHYESHAWAVRCCHGDAADGEDVLHRTYMKVLGGEARFSGKSAFKTWLFGVIRQTAREQARQTWLRLLRLERWWREREPDEEPDSEDERIARLRHVLGKLSKRQQEVLHLVFYQNLTIQEAADVLDMPVGTARTHYERGKVRLRELLEERR
ncbi:MAG TPA: RNA polymerase sigma factor [Gemmatimonadaceae bacterium]|nr:RNA polymerase sigma factor [Gemmatimonadaceae bacterium]